jgi:hypothetical protein
MKMPLPIQTMGKLLKGVAPHFKMYLVAGFSFINTPGSVYGPCPTACASAPQDTKIEYKAIT